MENVKFYSEDVLVEILCRLPEKPLIRFKCVSKTWYSLISEVCVPRISLTPSPVSGLYFRTFALSDSNGQGNKNFFLEYASLEQEESGGGEGFVDTSCSSLLPFRPSAHDLLDSCNGLVLFVNPSNCQYYVCNPTIKQCVRIPKACAHRPCSYVSLAFNPSESPHYKVVRIRRCKSKPPWLDIYASRTGQWVRHTLQLDTLVVGSDWIKHSVYLNGALYRLSRAWRLLRFDLNVVHAHVIELPEVPRRDSGFIGCIGLSMGHLCYAKNSKPRFLIWLLEDHCKAGQWTLKYSVCMFDLEKQLLPLMPPSLPIFNEELLWIEPYGFHPISDVIFIGTSRMILTYHLKSNTFKEVFRTRKGIRSYYPVFTHARCLVSLDSLGKMNCESTQLAIISDGMEVLHLEIPSDEPQSTSRLE